MIKLKTKEEIAILLAGGQILGAILNALAKMVAPGITTLELEEEALNLIKKAGGSPAFKGYKAARDARPFPSALCTSINNEIVHGPAVPARYLKNGDIIGLDIGMRYQNLYTDTALTIGVGDVSVQAQKLIAVTEECLNLAIKQVRPGNSLLDIARAVEINAEANHFSVVRELVGHGVGHAVHEDPQVPNYDSGEDLDKIILQPGLVIAIEPMLATGSWQIQSGADGFSFVTADKGLAAHFEHTIAVTEDGHIIITQAA